MEEIKEENAIVKKEIKPKKPLAKKPLAKKKPQDTMTRFFNSYGETPFLQSIEDSYLKYLEH